jgi:hypothetical protein
VPIISGPIALPPGVDARTFIGTCGARIPITLSAPQERASEIERTGGKVPAPVSGVALIDTGSSVTSIDESVAAKLGLKPIGQPVSIEDSGGPMTARRYSVAAALSECGSGLWTMTSAKLAPMEIIALVGTDVLVDCVFVFDGPHGAFTLSF